MYTVCCIRACHPNTKRVCVCVGVGVGVVGCAAPGSAAALLLGLLRHCCLYRTACLRLLYCMCYSVCMRVCLSCVCHHDMPAMMSWWSWKTTSAPKPD